MRQVLVEKSSNIKDISFNKAFLSLNEDKTIGRGNNRLMVPFDLKVIQGGTLTFRYRIAKELAIQGIMLVAAYEDTPGQLELCVINLSGTEYTLKAGQPLVEISAYEEVRVRQIEPAGFVNVSINGGANVQKPLAPVELPKTAKKRGKRK